MSEEFKLHSHIHADRYISVTQREIDGTGTVARVVTSNGYNDCTVYLDADQLAELGKQMIKLSKDLRKEPEKVTLKEIVYRGRVAKVPVEVKWIATDKDGVMWGYESKPDQGYVEWFVKGDDPVVCIGALCGADAYWKNSLKEFD